MTIGERKKQRLTGRLEALPPGSALFLLWFSKVNAKLLLLQKFWTVSRFKVPSRVNETLRHLSSFTLGKDSFPAWSGQSTGFLLRNVINCFLPQGTFNLFEAAQYCCITSYLHQQMKPPMRRLKITFLSFAMPLPGPLSQFFVIHSVCRG